MGLFLEEMLRPNSGRVKLLPDSNILVLIATFAMLDILFYSYDCTRRSVEVVTQTSVLNTILSHAELL